MPTRMAIIADGPLGGLRAGLRQRRRRDVRARTAAGSRRAARRGGSRRWPTTCAAAGRAVARSAAARSTPTCGPRAATVRWSAPSTPTRPTTASGRRSWEAQALLRAAPIAGDQDLCERFIDADRPAAVPGGGHHPTPRSARYAGSRPGWTPNDCRAAPTRPPTSSSGAEGSPTSSGPCSCCRCSTPASRRLRTTKTLEALHVAVEHDLITRRRRGPARAALEVRQPRTQRRPSRSAARRPTSSLAMPGERAAVAAILQLRPGGERT